jgi:hypothetical protein
VTSNTHESGTANSQVWGHGRKTYQSWIWLLETLD